MPPRRLRLTVAYDGRPFQGWQSQAHRDTIQDRLEAALAALCDGQAVRVHGAGRTDAGVHAHGQVAHADLPDSWRLAPGQSVLAINAHLPAEIRVLDARLVKPTFHARFSARGKIYRYRIWNGAVLDPVEIGRAWHMPAKLDETILSQAIDRLAGTHDFAGFAANRGKLESNTVRTIWRIAARRRGPLLTLEFRGNGFLYKMVRLLTGSIVRCGQGRAELAWLDRLLAGEMKSSFTAPAEGLYLVRVLYGRGPVRASLTAPERRAHPPA